MLNILRRRASEKRIAERLYAAAVEHARQPGFYTDLGVADTFDGRFDLVVLHGWLLADALRREGFGDLEQRLIQTMFLGFEDTLRDQGIGDAGVSRRAKAMTSALFGRMKAYEAAGSETELVEALMRNLYRDVSGRQDCARRIAHYIAESRAALSGVDLIETMPVFASLAKVPENTN